MPAGDLEFYPLEFYLHSVPPGESVEVYIDLYRGHTLIEGDLKIEGMRTRSGAAFRSMKDIRLMVMTNSAVPDASVEVSNLRLEGSPPTATLKAKDFFPFVDELGQYRHADWPGKVSSPTELADDIAREAADIAIHGESPEKWNRYGGWEGGPQLEATGQFRLEKRDGKWWLVDLEGRLFWSHGVTSVISISSDDHTGVTRRENYFSLIPKEGPPGAFYRPGEWKTRFYASGDFHTYNFKGANLYRKYGDKWREAYFTSAASRLQSWRLNSVGAFSYAWRTPISRKVPYLDLLRANRPVRLAPKGRSSIFPDPFDDGFRPAIRRAIQDYTDKYRENGITDNDPMRIGFFLDNEPDWGYDPEYVARVVLRTPENQAARIAFADYLRTQYSNIDALNAAWGTKHPDWRSWLASTDVPSGQKTAVKRDLAGFNKLIAHKYFSSYKEEINKAFPGSLIFGVRFSGPPDDSVLYVAAEYCDALAMNMYCPTVAGIHPPKGVDKPFIMGEFHFGALDRGLLHPGLSPVRNQAERAKVYIRYVQSALHNPYIVGTHYYQYGAQAVAGRVDGEAYDIGMVDICDRPCPELIQAIRDIGNRLYSERRNATLPPW